MQGGDWAFLEPAFLARVPTSRAVGAVGRFWPGFRCQFKYSAVSGTGGDCTGPRAGVGSARPEVAGVGPRVGSVCPAVPTSRAVGAVGPFWPRFRCQFKDSAV